MKNYPLDYDEEEERADSLAFWSVLISTVLAFVIMSVFFALIAYGIGHLSYKYIGGEPYYNHTEIWKWSGIVAAASMWRCVLNLFFPKY